MAAPADPHSYARPDDARVVHVSLDVRVDFASRRLSGTAKLSVALLRPAKEIVLDTRGLEIHEVRGEHDEPLPFTLDEPDALLGARLTITLSTLGPSSRDATHVTVRYTTGPGAPALDWLEPAQTVGGEHPFLFTQGHAIQTRSWIPLQDSPAVRQTYDARVRVPRALTAVMSAAHLGATDDGDERVFAFEMREPIASYLVALAVGALAFREMGPRTGVYVEPAWLDRAAHELAEMESMIDAAETLGGPYQWERFDVVVMPPSFPYGGMENPRLTFASSTLIVGDRSLTTVIAHELAHAWAGNLVTNATWNDFWLNEGVTVYFELRINEALWGADRARLLEVFGARTLATEIERLGASSPDTRLRYDMTGRDPVEGVTAIPYLKGAALLSLLERTVGRARFDPWLRGWFERHAFSSVTTETFVADLGEHLFLGEAPPFDLTPWLDEPGGRPEGAPPPSRILDDVDAKAARFVAGAPASSLGRETWRAQEERHFLTTLLDADLPAERLAELDEAFAFALSRNAEVLFAWLRLAARHHYDPARAPIERFVAEQGRGKYLRPLYAELISSEWGADLARRAFAASRDRYHVIVRTALDALFSSAATARTT